MLGHLMEAEIREQPSLLEQQSARYFDDLKNCVGQKQFDMALLVARGSSDHAALYLRYLLEIHLGIPVSLAAPSAITRFESRLKYPKCLAVGISQSGAGPDVAEVIAFMRRQGHTTLAITNTSGSRLTEEAEYSLTLGCGTEKAVAATKTYTSSLLACYQLARALGADLIDPASYLPTDAWVETTHASAQESLGAILRSTILFSLGRGYDFSTCQETALKMMECALLPCKAYSLADFEHCPRALAGHGSAAIIYGHAPDGLDATGCLSVLAPAGPASPLGPISNVIFGQWLCLLAARARGLNPDAPRNLRKVTLTL